MNIFVSIACFLFIIFITIAVIGMLITSIISIINCIINGWSIIDALDGWIILWLPMGIIGTLAMIGLWIDIISQGL